MPKFAARKDTNHRQIVVWLEGMGWTWRDTHRQGDGWPDGVAVYSRYSWLTVVVEIKSAGGKLEPDERRFWLTWPGLGAILQTGEDARQLTVLAQEHALEPERLGHELALRFVAPWIG